MRAINGSIRQERVYAFAVRRTRSHISVHNAVDCFAKADEYGLIFCSEAGLFCSLVGLFFSLVGLFALFALKQVSVAPW
jgi:hypothetical protein